MRHFLVPMLAACLWLTPFCGKAQDGGRKAQGAAIAVIDFDYVDTSGEERDQRKEHEVRLGDFMRALRDDLAKGGSFWLVTPACVPNPCSLAGSTVADLLATAREAGADILLIGGVHKMSTLVQWAKIEAIDARTGRVMFDKLFTFRGDTDEAWRRAESFIVKEIAAVSSQPVSR
jgi:hypothetical protein